MPVVTVTLIEGYDAATREALQRRLTHAVQASIAAPLDGITVVVHEVPAANYMRGGQRRQPGPPRPPAAELVRGFLQAMEARDLERARGYLADGFTMTFPGGVEFRALEELVAWGKTRYRSVAKVYERIEEATAEVGLAQEGRAIYCFGTLQGQWPEGTAFSGVRFIDRFTLVGDKLTDQRVWNDLAEVWAAGETSKLGCGAV
jgi:4-oxalocrotonate tautomerase family enzyme